MLLVNQKRYQYGILLLLHKVRLKNYPKFKKILIKGTSKGTSNTSSKIR